MAGMVQKNMYRATLKTKEKSGRGCLREHLLQSLSHSWNGVLQFKVVVIRVDRVRVG